MSIDDNAYRMHPDNGDVPDPDKPIDPPDTGTQTGGSGPDPKPMYPEDDDDDADRD